MHDFFMYDPVVYDWRCDMRHLVACAECVSPCEEDDNHRIRSVEVDVDVMGGDD